MNDQSPAFSYQADMGFTRQELLKGLPTAVLPLPVVGTIRFVD